MISLRRFFKKKHLHSASRFFWGGVLGFIITLAIVVQLGRQAFPLLNDYREVISEKLGDSLGVVISVETVDAKWSGLKPEITLRGVKVQTLDLQPIFDVSQASAQLSIISSILNRSFAWRRIIFNDFNSKVVQDRDGKWGIPGYEFADTDDDKKFRIDDPFDLFLFGRRVEINNANLFFQFRSGRESILSIPRVSLENDRYFHRLKADIDLDENDQAFSLVIEGYGDPRTDEDFSAKGFLDLQNFPAEKVLAVLGFDGLNALAENISDDARGEYTSENNLSNGKTQNKSEWDKNQRVDLSVWFGSSPKSGMTFEGSIDARIIDGQIRSVPQFNKMKLPTGLSSHFKGEWHSSKDWFTHVQDASVSWSDDTFTVDRMSFYGKKDDGGEVQTGLRLDNVDLDKISQQLVYTLNGSYPKIKNVLSSLSLKGEIKSFDVILKDKDEGFFLASGFLENGSVEAFLGSPEIKNVNGYFESSLFHGAIKLFTDDEFSLFLPKLYAKPMVFETAEGIIDWRINIDSKVASINSSQLTVTNSDEIAHGFLNLHLPFKREYGESSMNLIIGAESTKAIYHKKYIPERVSKALRTWLGRSIQAGDLQQGAFLFKGSLNKQAEVPPNIQVAGNVTNAQLKFDSAWPSVTDIIGSFRLDNKDLNVDLSEGDMLGAQLESARARFKRGSNGGLELFIDVKAQASANQGKNIVVNSSLPEALKKVFYGWELDGSVDFDGEFIIPMKSKVEVGYDIDLDFRSVDLRLIDLNLPLRDIYGQINISDNSLIFSENMSGKVFDEVFEAKVFADQAQGFLGVDFSTLVKMNVLNDWLQRPELQFAEGQTDVVGRVHIPIAKSNDDLFSDVIGIESDSSSLSALAPADFQKNTIQQVPNELNKELNKEVHTESSFKELAPIRARRYSGYGQIKREIISMPETSSSVMLALASSLSGVRLNAPEPLAKLPEEVRNFSSIITLGSNSNTYRFVLGEQLAALLSTSSEKGLSLGVAVNDTSSYPFLNYRSLFAEEFRRAQTISVFGSPGDVKLNEWLAVKDKYFAYKPSSSSQLNSEKSTNTSLTTELDLDVSSLELGEMKFSDLNIGGVTDREKWMFDLTSDDMKGKLFLFNNNRPMKIALERLKLPRKLKVNTEASGVLSSNENSRLIIENNFVSEQDYQGTNPQSLKPSMLSDVNLEILPDMTISVGKLLWGDEDFGRWSFNFRQTDSGIKIENLLASVKGININGVPDQHEMSGDISQVNRSMNRGSDGEEEYRGAQFFWDKSKGIHQSRFLGRLDGKNLGAILENWGQEKLLDSQEVNALIDVDWPGAPDQFTLNQLQGRVVFDLNNGSFIRGADVGENPLLRLFALLNFDTLARRLRLDFSDLAARGFSFDEVDGDVSFDDGILYLTNPITVVSSTSKMQLAGTVDLVEEEIDAELVATLPVASNVAFATAFVAGLPAALGVYVIGKLFKEQVDKASSINYGITGDWSDPKLRVKEVFNDTAAEKKGKQTKQKFDAKDVTPEIK